MSPWLSRLALWIACLGIGAGLCVFIGCENLHHQRRSVSRAKIVKPSEKGRGGKYYVVKPGDTIWKVARGWKVPVQDIAEWNNIQDPDKIFPGRKLYIPTVGGAERRAAAKPTPYDEPIRLYHGRFLWPVQGPIYSPFGIRDGRRHDGVDIGAKAGTPIHAAADGEVVYSDTLSSYGHLMILRHADQFYSTYAHNARNVAKLGQRVRRGEIIAYVGATGRATGPHLHFEIRHGQKARNPLFFLPENGADVARLKNEGALRKKAKRSS